MQSPLDLTARSDGISIDISCKNPKAKKATKYPTET